MGTGSDDYLSLVKKAFSGELKLPAFQRGFKWKRKQVILLYDSLRRSYPVGSIIFLDGKKEEIREREFNGSDPASLNTDASRLVLDGQQRLTAGIDLFYSKTQESRSQYFIDLKKVESLLKDDNVDIEDEEEVQKFIVDLDMDSGYCVAKSRIDGWRALLDSKHLLCTVLLRPDNSRERDRLLEQYEEAHPGMKQILRNVVKPHFIVHTPPGVPYVSIDSKLELDAISRIFSTLNSSGQVLTPFELVVAVLYSGKVDLREDLAQIKMAYPLIENMDKSGEICLQTVVRLKGKNHKKSLLPKELKSKDWLEEKDKSARLLNEVGDFLNKHLGMALDRTDAIVPYDSIFLPLAVVFHRVQYGKMKLSDRNRATAKIVKWVVGACLTQRYQEGVHTKQAKDEDAIVVWVEKNDPAYEPSWLKEMQVPALRSVGPSGAIANILKCLVNRQVLKDPLTDEPINYGLQKTHSHHIFPKKFVEKLDGWSKEKGDSVDLFLNTMQLSAEANGRFLNDDPRLQVKDARAQQPAVAVSNFAKQGVSEEALAILEKPEKSRDDYWNFIKIRETYFESLLQELGFDRVGGVVPNDDLEEA